MTEQEASELLSRAIGIANTAHRGQVDLAGQPYILHPLRVMLRATTLEEQLVAVLHDVIEDSDWTFDALGMYLPDRVVSALDTLTKRKGEPYEAYLERVASDLLALPVKLWDLEDNLDVLRLLQVGPAEAARLSRYLAARKRLLEALEAAIG
jgi:(p)ppGpp synthase/HD superfamily hydrolase